MPLLERIRAEGIKTAIVTNNPVAGQKEKLDVCGLTPLIDVSVVSEEVGVLKPDPHIFRIALERVGCRAEDAVMVGDMWDIDILGARAAEIRAIWLNRFGLANPDPALATKITSFEPVDDALRAILADAH